MQRNETVSYYFFFFSCYISEEKELWILLSILYLKSSIYVMYLILRSVLKIFDIIQLLFYCILILNSIFYLEAMKITFSLYNTNENWYFVCNTLNDFK